jgi:putative intracellular protease/amidase
MVAAEDSTVPLMLLPERDFDPTESAVPWGALTDAGYVVRFATPSGRVGAADERLVTTGFGPLSPLLMTRRDALERYRAMGQSPAFRSPLRYEDVDPSELDLLIVPGGHAPGMKSMLESEAAQRIVVEQFRAGRPVGAVCHGVVLLARSIDPTTARSVLHGRKTTALTTTMELSAWAMTKPFLGDYYRTYPQTVQAEVTLRLRDKNDFNPGPFVPIRDSAERPDRGFVVRDGSYVSARWPGDCHAFGQALVRLAGAAPNARRR